MARRAACGSPPIDPARLAALEQELQSERRRREQVEDELRQLQVQKRSPPPPPPPPVPPPEPRPGLELGPAGFALTQCYCASELGELNPHTDPSRLLADYECCPTCLNYDLRPMYDPKNERIRL